MPKTAIITGVTGQDGAYLARRLLNDGDIVVGTYRAPNFWRLQELGVAGHDRLELVEHDLKDLGSSIRLLDRIKPDEVYNLAAQSAVHASFNQPVSTAEVTGIGALNMLESIRIVNEHIRFYQASTSELFGNAAEAPQTEETPFYPRSPYAVAKLFAHWATVNYREAFGMFCSAGILFNHESPLRGESFVTRKISKGVAEIHAGRRDCIELGNLNVQRDWGYAEEYVDGMIRMLRNDAPDTFVLATNRSESVRRFVELSFQVIGVEISWRGEGETEIGFSTNASAPLVKINPKFYRPADVTLIKGDASKAESRLGWRAKTNLEELCALMVKRDLDRIDAS
ncbi:MAG: GDP-mannose 4,6-dehydratase [Pseudomonadota bacterium]